MIIIIFIFVDDTTLIANNIRTIKHMFETYIGDSHEHNLHINNDKTKLMIFHHQFLSTSDRQWLIDNNNTLEINGIDIEFINEIKLLDLGFLFNNKDSQFQSQWKYNLDNAIKAWNFLLLSNYIHVSNNSLQRNITIIETKIRPILEHGFSIIPINKKFMKEYDKFINKCYKRIIRTRITSNSTIARMIIKYDTTFQRNNARLLGYYHRMMNSQSTHKNIKIFRQDVAVSYDTYDDDLVQVSDPFTIDYRKTKTHSQTYIILLDKLGLSKYKYFSEITNISKRKWKKLVAHQLGKIQYNQDIEKINQSKNHLIKYKFQSWYECDMYYIKESIFKIISRLSEKYNPYIWKLLTNDLKFNWKCKHSDGSFIYKYPNCIFCKQDWHINNSPSQHIFEQCVKIHELLNIKIDMNDDRERKYSKWNLVQISKLADLIQKRVPI